ncbi:hypothetical protein P3L10_031223 [Capsicum annuum]
MPMNSPNTVFGDQVLKCQLEKPFDELRSIMKNENIDGLFNKTCYKAVDLMVDLEDKDILKYCKEKLCLVWFVHSILLARDIRKVIEDNLLEFADDFDKFNNHPWGYDSYCLTVQYLLAKLSTRTIILYGFSWAFMAWACEAIPLLHKQFKDYPSEVSHPRILRWLVAAKGGKKNIKEQDVDLFNPLDDAVHLLSTKIICLKERY